MDPNETGETGAVQVEEPVLGCADHAEQAPLWTCPACVAKYGLKPTTPNLKAMMSVGAIRARYKPGQSGNPGPKPRVSFEALAFRLLDEVLTDDRTGATMERRELVLRRVFADAVAGKPQALKLVLERAWPKRIKHEVEGAMRTVVVFDDQDRQEMGDEPEGGAGDGE